MVTRAGAKAAASAVSCERSQNAGITVFACVVRTSATVSESRGCTFQRMNCARPLLTRWSAGVVGIDVAGEYDGRLGLVLPFAEQTLSRAGRAVGRSGKHNAAGAIDRLDGCGEPFDFVADVVAQ